MLSAAVLLLMGSMLCALRLEQPGTFPKPLGRQEEQRNFGITFQLPDQ